MTNLISPIEKTNEVKQLKVEYTTNLDQFNFITGNRVPNPMHVARLKKSMERHGLLINPILINNKNEVIDGQHRFLASKELGLGVYYVIIGDYGLDEIHALNLNQKNWTSKDYMEGYANMGVEPYVNLRKFNRMYPQFPIGAAMSIMSGKSSDGSGQGKAGGRIVNGKAIVYEQKEVFSEGTWTSNSLDSGVKIAKKLIEVGQLYPKYSMSIFVKCYIGLLKKSNFNHEKFLHKLSQQPIALADYSTIGQFLRVIEEIYNYRSKYKVNLRF